MSTFVTVLEKFWFLEKEGIMEKNPISFAPMSR